jgi:4-diphosphocytidyl-2-C-methyl-D-erythritol kinase
MSRVTGLPAYHAVVAVPEAFLSTAAVYQLFDDMGGSEGFVQRVARQRDTLEALPDLPTLVSLMVNDLEPAATSQVPEIAVLKKELLSLGAAGALMSGSGPAVFGIFSRAADAQTAAARLSQDYRFVWAVDPLD